MPDASLRARPRRHLLPRQRATATRVRRKARKLLAPRQKVLRRRDPEILCRRVGVKFGPQQSQRCRKMPLFSRSKRIVPLSLSRNQLDLAPCNLRGPPQFPLRHRATKNGNGKAYRSSERKHTPCLAKQISERLQ